MVDVHRTNGFDAPADMGVSVSPSDSNDLPNGATRGLYVGGDGNVAVIMSADASNDGAGTAVTFVGVAAGTVLPIRVRRVMSTNTTATNIVALS